MSIFVVMFWVTDGQIYLLRHYWKTRFIEQVFNEFGYLKSLSIEATKGG